jgi:hypothetical protein
MNALCNVSTYVYNLCKPVVSYLETQYTSFIKKNENINSQTYLENSKKKLLKRYNTFYNKAIHFLGCMSLGVSMLVYTLSKHLLVIPFECLSIYLSSQMFSKLRNNDVLEENFKSCQYTLNQEFYTVLVPTNYIPKVFEIYYKRKENETLLKDDSAVRRFLGPNENFHGLKLTPKMIGFHEIYIYYEENRTIPHIFKEDDVLIIN